MPGSKTRHGCAALLLAVGVCCAEAATNSQPLTKAARDAIRRDLLDFTAAGTSRRLGPDFTYYNSNSAAAFPQIWMAPTRQDPGGRPYQIGGPWSSDPGDYSSTQGQILYTPDAGQFPVDRVTIIEWANYCFSEKPEPPWWGGFRPEPVSADWLLASGNSPGVPVGVARGMGSWANLGVIIFSSGLVGTAGTCTAPGEKPILQLPAGKIPTGVAVTPKNEFALITVCDVKTRKGQVAVLALRGGDEPDFAFAHDWADRYPCAPSTAWFANMKLLGFIDLPGIEFPTALTAVGNREGIRLVGSDGNVTMLSRFDLSTQAARDSFRIGGNAEYASRAGFAVVISKHENKAAFIDLQPLFQRVHDLYFTTAANFQMTRNVGPAPDQFPQTFDAYPAWKPPVIKVIDVPEPTAVIASMSGADKARAYIASMDGTVAIYKVGGLATEAPALASQIERFSEARIGRNPTCLTYQKLSTDTIIACSRGDREIAWIKHDSTGTRVTKRLRDSRLVDPVYVEMADTHGVETSIITVADYRGRQLVNYRFAPVVFATQGGAVFGIGPDGTHEFECGGVLAFPGSPYCISATNVN